MEPKCRRSRVGRFETAVLSGSWAPCFRSLSRTVRGAQCDTSLTKPFRFVVGLLYPAYRSFKALEASEEHTDEWSEEGRQWLTYWVRDCGWT